MQRQLKTVLASSFLFALFVLAGLIRVGGAESEGRSSSGINPAVLNSFVASGQWHTGSVYFLTQLVQAYKAALLDSLHKRHDAAYMASNTTKFMLKETLSFLDSLVSRLHMKNEQDPTGLSRQEVRDMTSIMYNLSTFGSATLLSRQIKQTTMNYTVSTAGEIAAIRKAMRKNAFNDISFEWYLAPVEPMKESEKKSNHWRPEYSDSETKIEALPQRINGAADGAEEHFIGNGIVYQAMDLFMQYFASSDFQQQQGETSSRIQQQNQFTVADFYFDHTWKTMRTSLVDSDKVLTNGGGGAEKRRLLLYMLGRWVESVSGNDTEHWLLDLPIGLPRNRVTTPAQAYGPLEHWYGIDDSHRNHQYHYCQPLVEAHLSVLNTMRQRKPYETEAMDDEDESVATIATLLSTPVTSAFLLPSVVDRFVSDTAHTWLIKKNILLPSLPPMPPQGTGNRAEHVLGSAMIGLINRPSLACSTVVTVDPEALNGDGTSTEKEIAWFLAEWSTWGRRCDAFILFVDAVSVPLRRRFLTGVKTKGAQQNASKAADSDEAIYAPAFSSAPFNPLTFRVKETSESVATLPETPKGRSMMNEIVTKNAKQLKHWTANLIERIKKLSAEKDFIPVVQLIDDAAFHSTLEMSNGLHEEAGDDNQKNMNGTTRETFAEERLRLRNKFFSHISSSSSQPRQLLDTMVRKIMTIDDAHWHSYQATKRGNGDANQHEDLDRDVQRLRLFQRIQQWTLLSNIMLDLYRFMLGVGDSQAHQIERLDFDFVYLAPSLRHYVLTENVRAFIGASGGLMGNRAGLNQGTAAMLHALGTPLIYSRLEENWDLHGERRPPRSARSSRKLPWLDGGVIMNDFSIRKIWETVRLTSRRPPYVMYPACRIVSNHAPVNAFYSVGAQLSSCVQQAFGAVIRSTADVRPLSEAKKSSLDILFGNDQTQTSAYIQVQRSHSAPPRWLTGAALFSQSSRLRAALERQQDSAKGANAAKNSAGATYKHVFEDSIVKSLMFERTQSAVTHRNERQMSNKVVSPTSISFSGFQHLEEFFQLHQIIYPLCELD